MNPRTWEGDSLFLFQHLVLKDFRIRYRNMSLGILWSFINPIVMMAVLTFIFTNVFGGNRPRVFPVFVLCGLVPYNFFTGAWMSGTISILDNASLVKRSQVPREVVPLAAVFSNCIHLLIQMLLLLGLTLFFKLGAGVNWFWLPLLWMLFVVFVCGISLLSSAINVYVRDTRYVVESFCLVLFWLVPIFYSFNIIPPKFAVVYRFNPVAALVLATRNILIDHQPPPTTLVINLTIAAALSLGGGLIVFRRLKPWFYEHI